MREIIKAIAIIVILVVLCIAFYAFYASHVLQSNLPDWLKFWLPTRT